jgi:ABC-type phosphate transport system auxiliary subunit
VKTSAPTPTPGLPYVGITASDTAPGIVHVLGGVSIGMSDPWAQWSASGLPTPTRFFNNATVQVIELANEDFGSPTVLKEMLQIRLQFQRNTRAYIGVFAESEGRRYGRWRGLVYPREEKLSGIKLLGRRLTLRLVIVYFNAQNFMLRDLSIDWLPAVQN